MPLTDRDLEQQANISKAEAILRSALASPVTEYQLQNREWARGVLADAWMAGIAKVLTVSQAHGPQLTQGE